MNYLSNIKQLIENNIVLKKKHKLIEDNSTLMTYFEIGRLIVEAQGGRDRAKYGDGLIKTWSIELTNLYGKGYDYTNLSRMRKLYLTTALGLTCLWSVSAFASGYQLNEYSITNLGRSFAGAGVVGDDYSAIAYNPAGMTLVGENEIPITFSSQLYGPVVECDPSAIIVNVERYMTRRVPVVIELTGETPDGLYLDTYKTDPTMLSVSGPQSLVTKVARAAAKMDLSALTAERMSDRASLMVELQAADGTPIASDKLEVTNQLVITDSVIVDTELVPCKEIPLDMTTLVKGEPAEGFELVDIEAERSTLSVAAHQEILDGLEFLVADQPLDISGAEADVSGFVRIKRVTGIENTLPGDFAVTARIQEETVERTMRQIGVEVNGLTAGYAAQLSNKQVTVQLNGGYRFITGLEKEDVRLFVDAQGLEPGEHLLPVQIHIDNAQPFTCALSTPEVIVTITE